MKKLLISILLSVSVAFSMVGTVWADNVKSPEVPVAAAAATDAYWTADRMKNALPYPAGISGTPADAPTGAKDAAKEPGGEATGSKTDRPSQLLIPDAAPAEASDIEPASSSYPFPHTTYKVLSTIYSVYPYRTIGKVFFTKVTGGNYVCSGSSIGGRAVLTAGHCVAIGGGGTSKWHKNWAFVPAYKDGSRPYGTWVAQQLWTRSEWLYSGRYSRDVGFGVVYNNGGYKLSQRVGYLGFSYNRTAYMQHWDAFGYPSAYPWNGGQMVQTEAEFARYDSSQGSPYTVGIGTSQRPGSSGGPWIVSFYPNQAGAVNYANGVFSYYYTSQPNGIYSPYFDYVIYSLRNTAITR